MTLSRRVGCASNVSMFTDRNSAVEKLSVTAGSVNVVVESIASGSRYRCTVRFVACASCRRMRRKTNTESGCSSGPVVVSVVVIVLLRNVARLNLKIPRLVRTPGKLSTSITGALWGLMYPIGRPYAESRVMAVSSTVSSTVIFSDGQKSPQRPGAVMSSVQAQTAIAATTASTATRRR